ncbi:MAG: 3-keto-5-aminohexanoate cleavage protein [Actinomycetota bacterium]
MTDKVIIEVGLNENAGRDGNPHIPYSPEEIAADARRCYEAGAAMVHYHARDPETGAPRSSDVELNLETQRLVNEAAPVIAYPTYGDFVKVMDGWYVIGSPAEQRFRHITAALEAGLRIEFGTIDLGSAFDLNLFRPTADKWVLTRGHQLNTGRDHEWLCRFCDRHGLKKTFAAFDTVHLINLRNLIDIGMVDDDPLVLKLCLVGGYLLEKRLLHALDLLGDLFPGRDVVWSPIIPGEDALPVTALALTLGGHVRIGIGDFHYGGGVTNAELVERVVALARACGREPATPDEARKMQGIAQ